VSYLTVLCSLFITILALVCAVVASIHRNQWKARCERLWAITDTAGLDMRFLDRNDLSVQSGKIWVGPQQLITGVEVCCGNVKATGDTLLDALALCADQLRARALAAQADADTRRARLEAQ
jgi:hypothetical protein